MADENADGDDDHDHDHAAPAAPAWDIDESFVPVRRDGLAQLDTDQGYLLFTPEGDTVRLNSTASILWQFFDGSVTVGELVDDVAAVYDLSRGEVVGDVVGVVRDLVARRVVLHPEVDLGRDPTRVASDGSLYRPDGCTPCGQHLEERTWEGKLAVAVGNHHLGIRCSHEAIHDALSSLLAAHLVDDTDAPNDFSIWLDAGDGTDAPTIDLFDYHANIWRGASAASVRTVLLTALARYVPTESILWVHGSAAVGPKGASVIPPQLTGLVSFAAGRLEEHGITIATPLVAIDPATAELAIGPLGLQIDQEAARDFDQLSDWSDTGPALAAPGRYPLVHWGLLPPSHESTAPEIDAVAAAYSSIDNLGDVTPSRAVELLGQLVGRLTVDLPDEDTDVIDHIVKHIT